MQTRTRRLSFGAHVDDKGLDLGVHPDPENSAVDPLQPIDFQDFEDLMTGMNKIAKNVNRCVLD